MVKFIISLLLFLLFVVFAVTLNLKNPESITFNYYFGIKKELALYIVLIAPFIVGLLLGVILMSISVVRNKAQVGKAKRALSKVEKEVDNLRSAPITEPMKDEISS